MIAKSNIILAVKPWDDETDMAEIERLVREVSKDGLIWGACELQQRLCLTGTMPCSQPNWFLFLLKLLFRFLVAISDTN